MQGANARAYIVPRLGAQWIWAIVQRLDCQQNRLDVKLCLCLSKMLRGPSGNVQKIEFGLLGQPNLPGLTHDAVVVGSVKD